MQHWKEVNSGDARFWFKRHCIFNNEVKSIIRQRASNVVAGYKILLDVYDPETQTAEIVVRQEGERIASQIERFITSK